MHHALSVVARLLLAVFVCFVVAASLYPAEAAGKRPPPPQNLGANISASTGAVLLLWTPPSGKHDIAGYAIYRKGSQIATVTPDKGVLHTAYDDLDSGGGDLSYFVKAFDSRGRFSLKSNSIDIVAPVPATTQPNTDSADSGNYANGSITLKKQFKQPDFKRKNQPTAFEALGTKGGTGTIYSSYGKLGFFQKGMTFLLTLGWLLIVMLQYGSVTFFAWSLSADLYGALGIMVATAITNFGSSNNYTKLSSWIMILAGAPLLYYFARSHRTKLVVAAISIPLALGASLAYNAHAPVYVKFVMNKPLEASQYIVGQGDDLFGGNSQANNFNLSVHPTYEGNGAEQSVRRWQNRDWLNTIYPAYCQINFGDLHWATTTFLPDRTDHATEYHHLTPCEYLLRAQNSHNQTELDYLNSSDHFHGLGGHHTGAIEKASKAAYSFYQGDNLEARASYVVSAGCGMAFRMLLTIILAAIIFGVVIISAIYLMLGAFYIMLFAIKPLQEWVLGQAVKLGHHLIKPAGFSLIIMLTSAIVSAMYQLEPKVGWLGMMILQAFVGMAAFVMVIYFVTAARRKRRETLEQLGQHQRNSMLPMLAQEAAKAMLFGGAGAVAERALREPRPEDHRPAIEGQDPRPTYADVEPNPIHATSTAVDVQRNGPRPRPDPIYATATVMNVRRNGPPPQPPSERQVLEGTLVDNPRQIDGGSGGYIEDRPPPRALPPGGSDPDPPAPSGDGGPSEGYTGPRPTPGFPGGGGAANTSGSSSSSSGG